MRFDVLFDQEVMKQFDFHNEYVGYVLDNEEFEKDFRIKVFIPELFGYPYAETIRDNSIELDVSTNHIINEDELNITHKLQRCDFIYATCLLHRSSFYSKETLISENKPRIGEKVMVKFINGNPQNCVYTNTLFLTKNENAYIYVDKTDGRLSVSSRGINIVPNEGGRIYWELD